MLKVEVIFAGLIILAYPAGTQPLSILCKHI